MTRSVDNVNLCILVIDADVFGENRDSAFPLQFVIVEHKFSCLLVITEEISCQQHLVYEGCFAVVNVGNYGYVSDALHTFFLLFGCKGTKK